jgi:5-dehydro-4-deoxyglucarate dehydratase
MARSPMALQHQVRGLLPFASTPFTVSGDIDLPRFREHLQSLANGSSDRPSCYFVCCGTGEFWSLDLVEYRALVGTAAEAVGRIGPVIAGVGYGTRLAIELARIAEEEGADGILVFPPYLAAGPQGGLCEHYASIAAATRLGVFVYNRDNAVFEPETVRRLVETCPNVIGLKDGYGELERLADVRRLLGDEFLILNGMPSAEMYAKTYCKAGIRHYSPGGIGFVPEIAWAFDRALESGDDGEIDRLVGGFYRPYTELRSKVPGYGVALIKAGLKLRGRPVGGVRPPLVDPSPTHEAELGAIIERGLSLVEVRDPA